MSSATEALDSSWRACWPCYHLVSQRACCSRLTSSTGCQRTSATTWQQPASTTPPVRWRTSPTPLWFASNSRQGGSKCSQAVAAVQEDDENLEEAVAALNMQPKQSHPKKKAAMGGKTKGTVCFVHKKYGTDTWKCAEPTTCTWTENQQARRLEQQQLLPWATQAVSSTWWMQPALEGTWWTLIAATASFPTSQRGTDWPTPGHCRRHATQLLGPPHLHGAHLQQEVLMELPAGTGGLPHPWS